MSRGWSSIQVQDIGLQKGDYIDVLDLEGIWNAAHVVKILVEYEGWGEKFQENVSIHSERIAPFQSFTREAKCWAKYDKYPWWPALASIRVPATEEGRKFLEDEEKLYVNFMDSKDFSKRTRCWLPRKNVRDFAQNCNRYRSAGSSKEFQLSLSNVLLSNASHFPKFAKGILPRKSVNNVKLPRKRGEVDIWAEKFSSGCALHRLCFVYGNDLKKSQNHRLNAKTTARKTRNFDKVARPTRSCKKIAQSCKGSTNSSNEKAEDCPTEKGHNETEDRANAKAIEPDEERKLPETSGGERALTKRKTKRQRASKGWPPIKRKSKRCKDSASDATANATEGSSCAALWQAAIEAGSEEPKRNHNPLTHLNQSSSALDLKINSNTALNDEESMQHSTSDQETKDKSPTLQIDAAEISDKSKNMTISQNADGFQSTQEESISDPVLTPSRGRSSIVHRISHICDSELVYSTGNPQDVEPADTIYAPSNEAFASNSLRMRTKPVDPINRQPNLTRLSSNEAMESRKQSIIYVRTSKRAVPLNDRTLMSPVHCTSNLRRKPFKLVEWFESRILQDS